MTKEDLEYIKNTIDYMLNNSSHKNHEHVYNNATNSINKLEKAIEVIRCCKSDSELLPNKWKERCLLAENFINETPCDPDIYQAQQEAWSEWITYKQAMENTK